jgi:hypothetical protein
MPTATRTSTQQKETLDAPRGSRPAADEARSPLPTQPEPLELSELDPYDLPCTD